jgi:ribosomal protein S8E
LLYRKKTTYTIAEVKSWTEHQVKVGKNTTYKELEIVFASFKKITIGKKEYTDYEKIVSYLKKKAIKRENSISK